MKLFNSKNLVQGLATVTLVFSASVAYSADYPEAGNFSTGSKVWADNCNRCHNIRGPKELRDDQWITTAFHMRIRGGLTGQETRDVITFLQEANTKTVAAGSTQIAAIISKGTTGKETYEKTCVACHGAGGEGAFPGTPDFTSSDGPLSKSDNVLLGNITNGFQSPDSPMAMPPKGGNPNLGASDISSVLKYIREVFGK